MRKDSCHREFFLFIIDCTIFSNDDETLKQPAQPLFCYLLGTAAAAASYHFKKLDKKDLDRQAPILLRFLVFRYDWVIFVSGEIWSNQWGIATAQRPDGRTQKCGDESPWFQWHKCPTCNRTTIRANSSSSSKIATRTTSRATNPCKVRIEGWQRKTRLIFWPKICFRSFFPFYILSFCPI